MKKSAKVTVALLSSFAAAIMNGCDDGGDWVEAKRCVDNDNVVVEGQQFLAQYYSRSYEAVANAMLCVTGSWDEVIDWMEKYRDAGARTVVLRFAANNQLATLEACAEALNRRGLL